jgi:hypothetical protein
MAGLIVTTTVLAASAAFTIGWIVARRKFVGRALVAEEKYLQMIESCRRQVATAQTQIQALNASADWTGVFVAPQLPLKHLVKLLAS